MFSDGHHWWIRVHRRIRSAPGARVDQAARVDPGEQVGPGGLVRPMNWWDPSSWPVPVRRWGPVCCWLAVVLADVALWRAPSYVVLGIIDEPAHLLTSVVLLSAVAALAGRHLGVYFSLGLLVSGNLIDLDHLPMSLPGGLSTDVLTAGTDRPYPHSVSTVAALLIIAALCRANPARSWSRNGAQLLAGAALGVSGHLFRDLGTAPVALFWPFSHQGVTIPHAAYLGGLLLLALAGPLRAARRVRSTDPVLVEDR